ncbi:MAG: hypothetical protein AB7Q29_02165 [Vicinamibacterales bacterium]
MSQLEQAVRPFLQPLLAGQAHVIPPNVQAIIARWAVKTAMVLEAQDPIEKRAYSPAHCALLRERAAMPWRTSVWLAAAVDPAWVMSTKNRHLGPEMHEVRGISTTMAFGHLAVQVLTMNVPASVGPDTEVTTDVRRGPWDQLSVQIWSPQDALSWPPSMGLQGEEGLNAFADRFMANDYSGEVDPFAV